MLRQDPSLDEVDPAPAPVEVPAAATLVESPAPPTLPGLFGRDGPLDQVTAALRDAAAGRGRVVVVSGEPGIGKTRFTEAVADRARALGLGVGTGGWEAEASPPLWGWRRAFDGVAR